MSNPEEGKSSPLLEELISAVQSSDGLAVGRLFERQGFEDVIQQLAKRHWQHRMAYNQA